MMREREEQREELQIVLNMALILIRKIELNEILNDFSNILKLKLNFTI
jgi:hypothetical protein